MSEEIIDRYNQLVDEAGELLEEINNDDNSPIRNSLRIFINSSYYDNKNSVFYYICEDIMIPYSLKVEGWKLKRDPNGNTPIMYRIMCYGANIYSDPDELGLEWGHGYSGWILDRNNDGRTPMMLAIMHYGGYESKYLRLFEYNGWVTDKDNNGNTPLMLSIIVSGKSSKSELYYEGWQIDRNNDGNTPLMLNIIYNKDNDFTFLYDNYKTDKNNDGNTPIMLSIINRHHYDNDFYYEGCKFDKNNDGYCLWNLWMYYGYGKTPNNIKY